jgi:hypothetical protein
MTVAYLTHDEVNAAAARELASRLGLSLVVLDIRQIHPTAGRLVCDLDHLPPEVKSELLSNARAGVNMCSIGVHSYHLTPEETKLLRAAGAVASRRLTARLLLFPVPCSMTVSA